MMTHVFKKSFMMAALLAAFAVAQADNAMAQFDGLFSGEANAVLDIGTGEVTLNLGPDLQVLGITGVEFDVAAFDATTGLGPAGQLGANGIGFLGLTPFPAGTFNIGAILDPSVRSEAALAEFSLQFGQAGVPAVTGTIANGGVTVINSTSIPEPGSLSLLALAGFCVVARRRR